MENSANAHAVVRLRSCRKYHTRQSDHLPTLQDFNVEL
jgi:hypothetical protein